MPLAELIIAAAGLVAVPALMLALVRGLDASARAADGHGSSRWLVGWKLWHILVAVLLTALVFAAGASRDAEVPAALAALVILGLFLRAWRHEFLFLMALRDDELPGRFDKLIWMIFLTLLAPIGVWLFRSFREAHWPEPVPAYKARPASELS